MPTEHCDGCRTVSATKRRSSSPTSSRRATPPSSEGTFDPKTSWSSLAAAQSVSWRCSRLADAPRRVIAVDGVPARRELAELLGAEAVAPEAAAAHVAEATDGLGADVVIEAAGAAGALDASLRLARGRGVVSVVGAHFEPDYPLDNALMFERELTLRFSIGDPTADGPLLLDQLQSGELDPTPVITHRMRLAEASEAYRLFDSREATKVVLAP